MSPSTANAGNDRRRPRSPSLDPPDSRRVRPQMRTASMPSGPTPARTPASAQQIPPGAVASSSVLSSAPPTYVRRTEDALLRAPARINQPHLHPAKLNGALWFGIDPEQQYYWEDKFHDEIYFKWKLQTQVTICGRISQKRRDNKQPKYIGDKDLESVLANWSTAEAKAKSQSAADSRTSHPPGMKMHVHGAGPRTFANIQYHMVSDKDSEELPSLPDLVRKTHTGKDGTFIDERAEALVLEVEQAVEEIMQEMTQAGSPAGDSQTCSTAGTTLSKRLLLNHEYIKRGKTKNGTVYGLGSVQYLNTCPSDPVPASSLKRSLDMEMRVCGVEIITQELKSDLVAFKNDFKDEMTAQRASLNMILQYLQLQASVPPASAAQPTQPQAQAPSHAPS